MSIPERQRRTHYRHELTTLTYVTLDEANGGIIRNLNHEGAAVQAVAPLRERQFARMRFELRFPRLRVDVRGQVSWANSTGQCGIRFIDLPSRTRQQINEWIFSGLLEAAARENTPALSMPEASSARHREISSVANDALTVSPVARPAIQLEPVIAERVVDSVRHGHVEEFNRDNSKMSVPRWWRINPPSGRTLAWLIDSIVMCVALFLFALIFLSITRELPPWPLTLGAGVITVGALAAGYWALFSVWGGASAGTRLARAASGRVVEEESESDRRFR